MKGDIIDVDNEHVVIDLTEDVPLDLTTSKSLYEIAKNHWDALTRVEGNRPVFNAQPLTIYNSRSSIAPRDIGVSQVVYLTRSLILRRKCRTGTNIDGDRLFAKCPNYSHGRF